MYYAEEDSEVHKKWKAEEERKKTRLENAVTLLCGSDDGVFFLKWLMAESGVFKSEFFHELQSAQWNEGRREIGLKVFQHCVNAKVAKNIIE